MTKPDRFAIFVFLFVLASWSLTVFFWFNNFDLAYIHGYIGIEDTFHNVNLKNLIRGHQIINFFAYLIFGLRPWGYYLVANILHAVAAFIGYLVFNKFFKDRLYSFFLANLVFVNFTYSNVLFEGIFNQYYSILLITFLVSTYLLQIRKYRAVGSAFLMALGLLFRETALVLFALVFGYLCLFSKSRKDFMKSARYLATMILVVAIYAYFRIFYLGELFSDLTDDAVQARLSFIGSGNYWGYFTSSFYNFSRMAGEQVFSYPVLYKLRDFTALLALKLRLYPIAGFEYFIPLFGFLVFLALFVISALVFTEKLEIKKDKRRIVYFGFWWFFSLNLFISLVLPFPKYIWNRELDYLRVLSRYNYYQVFGVVLLLGALFYEYRNRRIFRGVALILIAFNFFAIQFSSYKIYVTKHKPAKQFFFQVFDKYPDFSRKIVIYYNFFQVNNLRDWVYDLTTVFGKSKYPETEFFYESSLAEVQKKYLSSEYALNEIYAFDLDENGYFVDKTSSVREFLLGLREYGLEDDILANASYKLIFEARYLGYDESFGCNDSMTFYSKQRRDFLDNVSISAGSQYGQGSDVFAYVDKYNLVDNNLYKDSVWQAELGESSDDIVLDLGSIKEINGFSWVSNGANANPNVYDVLVSFDNVNYKPVYHSSAAESSSRIDYFDLIKARYVKIDTKTTLLGQPVMFYELEVNNYSDSIRSKYSRFDDLLDDMFKKSCPDKFSWGYVSAVTSSGTNKSIPIVLEREYGWKEYSLEIINYEAFMDTRRLFIDKLESITINPFNGGNKYEFRNFRLVP